jgi:hypothetical protein
MVVSKEEAESYVRKYMELQDSLRNSGLLEQLTDQVARSYYSSSYISFVFEKEDVYKMFTESPQADALRIYYAAHDSGEPTIVLICAQTKVGNAQVMNSAGSLPRQWPPLKGSRSGTGYTDFDIHNDSIY